MSRFITATLGLTILLSTASLASLTEVEDTTIVPPRKVGAAVRRDPSMDMQLARIAEEAILAGSPKKAKTKPKKKVSWGNVLGVRLFENSIIQGDTQKGWGYTKGVAGPTPNGAAAAEVQQEGISDRLLLLSRNRFNDMEAETLSGLSARYPSTSASGKKMHRKLLKYKKKKANESAERAKSKSELLEEYDGDHDE